MKLHEYQAKDIMVKYGIPVQPGVTAVNAWEAGMIARELIEEQGEETSFVIKAQVHAGGRGKAGGIQFAKSAEEVVAAADQILGMRLVTKQTGKEGRLVRTVLVSPAIEIEAEWYLGIVVDRARQCVAIMMSSEGGMEIEEVAAKTPEKIYTEYVDPAFGLPSFQARRLAFRVSRDKATVRQVGNIIRSLYKLFVEEDCSLAEINPLVKTPNRNLLAVDAKIEFDDNALFRHKRNAHMRDFNEEESLEIEASSYRLNFIKLDGNIGCMVNGAGLAMATMDLIKLAGAEPANFLDVGGGADVTAVENAFRIILEDPNVEAVLVNVFGGIVRCDRVAEGIIKAAERIEMRVPLVVRLEGTNASEAMRMLRESKVDIHVAESLEEAAGLAVKMAKSS